MSEPLPITGPCDAAPLRLSEDDAAEQMAALAWALAHPARVRIVRLLLQRKECVCGEIVAELPLAQSTVSQHLKILKEAGLILGEINGPKVCYCVDRKQLELFRDYIASL